MNSQQLNKTTPTQSLQIETITNKLFNKTVHTQKKKFRTSELTWEYDNNYNCNQ